MELEVLPSTAFSVLMEHSSTRTISSVIGGSTLTAPLLRIFTLSMMRLRLNVKLLRELLLILLIIMKHLLTMLLLLLLLVIILWREGQEESWEEGGITGEEEGDRGGEVELILSPQDSTCYL